MSLTLTSLPTTLSGNDDDNGDDDVGYIDFGLGRDRDRPKEEADFADPNALVFVILKLVLLE